MNHILHVVGSFGRIFLFCPGCSREQAIPTEEDNDPTFGQVEEMAKAWTHRDYGRGFTKSLG